MAGHARAGSYTSRDCVTPCHRRRRALRRRHDELSVLGGRACPRPSGVAINYYCPTSSPTSSSTTSTCCRADDRPVILTRTDRPTDPRSSVCVCRSLARRNPATTRNRRTTFPSSAPRLPSPTIVQCSSHSLHLSRSRFISEPRVRCVCGRSHGELAPFDA